MALGGLSLAISAGQHGVHAQTPGCNWVRNPLTSFKRRQVAAHTPPGCSGGGWDTAAAPVRAIASSDFLSTESLNTSVLHWGYLGSAWGETWDSQGCPHPSSPPGKCGAGEQAHAPQAKKP